MADVGASKEMLLHQLNALMADAAGDADTMELYQAKLAELDAARRANAELEQQLLNEANAKENLQRQLASVAQDAKTATDSLHDQLQTALADKVELERHLESVQRELGDVQEAKNSALGDLDRSNQEVDSLREELRDMRRRVQAAEDAGSEAQKVLHVMSAEAEASRREQDNLRERVAGVAETLAAVRVAERAAADARTALDSEVAALAHAAVRRGAPPPRGSEGGGARGAGPAGAGLTTDARGPKAGEETDDAAGRQDEESVRGDSGDEPVPSPTAKPVSAPAPACTAVDEDAWSGGSYDSCCDGLSECTEPRDPSSPYFSQYPTIQMCRTACAAETRQPTRQPTQGSPSNGGAVVVMSYNTEYTGYSDGRVPGFGAKISEVAPDLVGLQECQDANALAAAAPGYTVLGGTGPQNYILYDASRLEALESGWMDVPRDCYAQRTVTWGKFQIRATGDEFWFFNTHLPHNGCAATDRNTHAGIARQLVDKRNELGAGSTPTIVVGDCNPFASGGASEGSFESNLASRGIPLVYMGTGQFGGYGGLDKIFATTEWTTIDARDRSTGSSDHPAISAELRL